MARLKRFYIDAVGPSRPIIRDIPPDYTEFWVYAAAYALKSGQETLVTPTEGAIDVLGSVMRDQWLTPSNVASIDCTLMGGGATYEVPYFNGPVTNMNFNITHQGGIDGMYYRITVIGA